MSCHNTFRYGSIRNAKQACLAGLPLSVWDINGAQCAAGSIEELLMTVNNGQYVD